MKALALLLLLSGCGTIAVHQARNPFGALVGMNVVDLVDCAGAPDTVIQTSPTQLALQYAYKSDDVGIKAAFLTAELEIGGAATCKAVFTVARDGTVYDVAFPGARTAGFGDEYTACRAIVGECLSHPSATTLPANYDAFAYFLPAHKS